MKTFIILLLIQIVIVSGGCRQNQYRFDLPEINSDNLMFFPGYYMAKPGIPSPAITERKREVVIAELNDGRYSLIDATVENGEPFDYKRALFGKGNQLTARKEEFPGLTRNGIHSDRDLRNAKLITGRSVSGITVDGRPNGSSGVGFMADDETIMSVIYADNQTVKKIQLTHPDIARPLFHIWNISREIENAKNQQTPGENPELVGLIYNGKRVMIRIEGSRGWQESIFNDEILGTGHIEISRDLDNTESEFLRKNYAHLSPDQRENLRKMLSVIRTGEMVFFYINRYGFYEGHTEYRVDPVVVALIFGMRSIEDLDRICGNDLYQYLTTHFTQNPE